MKLVFHCFSTHALILECLKPSLAVIPVIFDPIQEIMPSVCSFSVVELVDGLQISSVSSAQSDSLTRTSVKIILTHSDLRMIIQTVWPGPQALSSIKSGGKSLVYNIHRESCQLPVPESGDTNQKCLRY